MAAKAALILATWFGCGYSPVAPGTAGSLGALAAAWALHRALGWSGWEFAVLAAVWLAPAVWASGVAADATGKEDPQIVVIDEVVGQWLALAGARVFDWQGVAGAFALFRLFDIWKPFPARRLERLPGGYGIVMDDVMAGVYAALVLLLAGCFNLY